MPSTAKPVWRPLSEQRVDWRDPEYTLSRRQVETLQATTRLREIAKHFLSEFVWARGVTSAGEVKYMRLHRPSSKRNYMHRNLDAAADYMPETPEGRAEWAKVRRICERLARRYDRDDVLPNTQWARYERAHDSRKQPPTTLHSQTSHGKARARESRPTRRARVGSSGSDDPSEPGDSDADLVGRQAVRRGGRTLQPGSWLCLSCLQKSAHLAAAVRLWRFWEELDRITREAA